jgi:hypothetical protein
MECILEETTNKTQCKHPMQSKQNNFVSLIKVVTCTILALGAVVQVQAEDKKADPTGTWSWTTPGRDGGPDRKSTLKLKLEGDKLTGTLSSPGRQGGQSRDTAIEDGKLNGDEISFKVIREFNNNKITQKYHGKISGDSIKGKLEFERNGEAQSRDWEAKREAEKK